MSYGDKPRVRKPRNQVTTNRSTPAPPLDPLRSLSAEEMVFFEHYMKHLDAAKAYDAWCIAAHRVPGKQRHTNSYKMLHKPRMQSAIIETQKRVMENSTITAIKVLNDLEEARIGAMNDKQFAAAINASKLQGLHIGMFNEGYADREKGPMIVIVSGTGREEGQKAVIEFMGSRPSLIEMESPGDQ